MNRRQLLGGAGSLSLLALSGCTTTTPEQALEPQPAPRIPGTYATMYGPMPGERFPIPAVDLNKVPESSGVVRSTIRGLMRSAP